MARRRFLVLPAVTAVFLLSAAPALACGGLIGPNGAVNLLRTTTFAGYHDGVEHYVTSFEYAGGGGAFGSLTPLPGIPTSVEKGGDWTLQRLILETDPPNFRLQAFDVAASAGESAEELMKVKIDALDLTVLRGGADQVGQWAREHGFRLPADAPEVLEFYASRSPIFLAAAFDASAATERGQNLGDGTPVHITIPTDNPWVPLRILALGKAPSERVEADVYLLTDARPNLLPQARGPRNGLFVTHSDPASQLLLDDLRSDRGMAWVPAAGWLTKLEIDAAAGQLSYDLAVDAMGLATPSRIDAGFDLPPIDPEAASGVNLGRLATAAAVLLGGFGILGLVLAGSPTRRTAGEVGVRR